MKRRDFLSSVSVSVGMAGVLGIQNAAVAQDGGGSQPSTQSVPNKKMTKKRPNFLITISDDQRPDTLGFLGENECKTPALDKLAQRGCYFPNAYHGGATVNAVCSPTRGQTHTGMPLFQLPNLIKGWWEDDSDTFETPDPDTARIPFLGEILRREGYQTFGTGKWHNMPFSYIRSFNNGGAILFSGDNTTYREISKVPGMDEPSVRVGKPDVVTRGGHYNKVNHIFDPAGEYPPGGAYIEPRHGTEGYTDAVVRFLDNYDGDQPFFIYLAYTAPHGPQITDPEWHAIYDTDKIKLPENYKPYHEFDTGGMLVKQKIEEGWRFTEEQAREKNAGHYALVTHMDDGIRRVYEALERNGFLDDTVVVHTSDHGKSEGNHGLVGKQSLYDEAVKIPLIMAGPGIPQGEQRDQLVYSHDLFPTILNLAGAEIPETTYYQDLAPVMEDKHHDGREAVFSAFKAAQRMAREKRFKYICYDVEGVGHEQLYDLEKDPHELNNLADQSDMADTKKRLRKRIRGWQKDTGDPCDVLSATA